jgi:hypothetical protein
MRLLRPSACITAARLAWWKDRATICYALLLAVCFFAPLLAHLFSLPLPYPLNVDEAQWTVSARRILDDPVVWRSNDLTTSGPLNALAISWPFLFGHLPSLRLSRLTGFLLESGALLGVASLVRTRQGFGPAAAAILMVTAYLTMTVRPDYLHYSSESLSVALIAFCAVCYVRGTREGSATGWLPACGLAASCLPFAKLQSAPFCLLFHAFCAAHIAIDVWRDRTGWTKPILYLVAGTLPILLLVVPPFFVGEQQAVLVGYFGLGAGYGGARSLATVTHIAPLFLMMAVLSAMIIAARQTAAPIRWDLVLLSLGLWPVVFVCLWLPGRPYDHYRHYAFIALPLAVVLLQRGLQPTDGARLRRIRQISIVLTGAVCIACIGLMMPYRQQLVAEAAQEAAFAGGSSLPQARRLFAWLDVKWPDTMLMWGWEPAFAEYAGLKSADRASHAEYLIRPNNGRAYFRDRLLRDLSKGKPALIMDAVRNDYFFTNFPDFNASTSELRSFPALNALVQSDYQRIGPITDCAALYLRDDLVAAWQRAEIKLTSSAAELVDGSITEKCNDWWQPSAQGARATLTLSHPEPIAELWFLASRGGPHRDRGTSRIKLTMAYADGGRSDRFVHLFDYPLWTVVDDDTGRPVTSVDITLLDSIGTGPALNEVKAFRVKGWGR